MKLGDLTKRARRMMEQRGGSDALKQDAQELRDIARGEGSLQDKAKRAAEAMREPGGPTPREEGTPPPTGSAPQPPTAPSERPGEPPAPPRP